MAFRRPNFHRLHLLALAGLVCASPASWGEEPPQYSPDSNSARESIPQVYKWDLTAIFPSDAAWEQELERVGKDLDLIEAFRGSLGDPSSLYDCLKQYFETHDATNRVTLYANLNLEVALTDKAAQERAQRSQALMSDFMDRTSFIRNELLALSDKQLEKAYKKQSGLEAYKRYIDNLRRRRGSVLSDDAERVLSLAGDNLWAEIDLNEIPSRVETAYSSLMSDIPWPLVHDADGNEVQLTLSNYPVFRRDPDREVRREAVSAFLSTLRQYEHTFTATLSGQADFDVFLARSRGYDTALEAYLDKDDLDTAVFENLISTVHQHLEPLHRYIDLRKQVMGVDEVHLYDLYVPLVEGVDSVVTFEQARQQVLEALQPMGQEYLDVLSQGIDPANGWIDLYPSKDKDSGAFSASVYGRHPYVLMNFQDSLDDMSTLAHEFGHAMHSYLSMHNQSYQDFRYVPFLAEIASTANEALLGEYLLGKVQSEDERAYLLADRMEGIRTTIYRQVLFAEFEWKLHQFIEQGTPVTSDLLRETYEALLHEYYGSSYTVDENDGMEWAYVPHFYWKYYLFTYATGLSSGIAIAERLLQGGDDARDAYLGMLKSGCSAPPLDILRGAGVDLTRPDAIVSALEVFEQTVAKLEELLLPEPSEMNEQDQQ